MVIPGVRFPRLRASFKTDLKRSKMSIKKTPWPIPGFSQQLAMFLVDAQIRNGFDSRVDAFADWLQECGYELYSKADSRYPHALAAQMQPDTADTNKDGGKEAENG